MAEKANLVGLVLAGGASRRMGTDKAGIDMAGRPLVDHVAARLSGQVARVWLNLPPEAAHGRAYRHLPDTVADRPGPLAGILAGLLALQQEDAAATHLLTIPVDTPFFPEELAEKLSRATAPGRIVTASSQGRIHPVIALWPRSLAADLADWLNHPDHRRVFDFIDRHPHDKVEFEPIETPVGAIDPFFNINTPADLEQAQALAKVLWT